MACQVARCRRCRVREGSPRLLAGRVSRPSKVAGMAFDVARVRGLHTTLGDGWVHFDAQAGMLVPDSVSTTVSTAFRTSMASAASPHPSARRSAALLEAARQAVADLVNGDPRGVVLGA